MSTLTAGDTVARPGSSLLHRQLSHYPSTRRRYLYLAVTVLATVTLYYELYIQGSVSTTIITQFHFSFTLYVVVLVVGNAVGALASLGAGLADRWGRANLVVYGVLLTGLLTLLAIPAAHTKFEFTLFLTLVSLVEGCCLVATPALVRDFSPQTGRASAMAFWTMGPVLGSLVCTEVSSHTLAGHPGWAYQFRLCGAIGLVVWIATFLFLRELSPRLRDQQMGSLRERALVEARAAKLDPELLGKGVWKQMLTLRVAGPAFAISIFLILYYITVAFIVVYFATVYGYSTQRANDLANWFWITDSVALIGFGVFSDKLKVRKPLMIVGGAISLIGTALFAIDTTNLHTSYGTFALLFVLIALGAGCAYVCWMAAFTETVEKINPAAAATGLAVWGGTLRVVVTLSFAIVPIVVPAVNTLVGPGQQVQAIAAKYPQQLKVLKAVDASTLQTLSAHPKDQGAQVSALAQLTGLPKPTVATVVANGSTVKRAGARLTALSRMPKADVRFLSAHGARTDRILAAYPRQIKLIQRVGTKTMDALSADPNSVSAQAAAVAVLTHLPAVTVATVISSGPAVQAAGDELESVQDIPAADLTELSLYGDKVDAVVAAYPEQVKVLQTVNAGTLKALAANPNDASAGASAASQLSGIPAATVARVLEIETTYPSQIATGKVIDPATAAALLKDPTQPAAFAKATKEIMHAFGISKTAAGLRLLKLAAVPHADLSLVETYGVRLLAVQAELKSVDALPAADLELLETQATRVQQIADAYPSQVALLQRIDATTAAQLGADPDNQSAQAVALSELTGYPQSTTAADLADGGAVQNAGDTLKTVNAVPAADLAYLGKYAAKLQAIVSRYPKQVKVLQTVNAATLRALDHNSKDLSAQAKAIAQLTRLPVTAVAAVLHHGTGVQAAAARLRSLSKVPASATRYLSAHAAPVEAAQAKNPGQWQTLWWICFGAQLLFLPFVFLLTGRWSPRRAREDQRAHDAAVEAELAALPQSPDLPSEREDPLHRKLAIGVVTAAATLGFAAAPALAATTPVPLSFDHVVLDTPATGMAQVVTPSTQPLTVTADVDPSTGDFTIAPSAFSAPTYKFTSPVAGSATLSLASQATGTVDFSTGAVSLTADMLATIDLGSDGSCVVNTGSMTLSTATTKPLPGKAFGAGATTVATGDGAFGVGWSSLPASSDGSACSVVNSVVDGAGGIWISRGIAPTGSADTLLVTPVKKTASVVAGKTATVSVTLANTGAADTKTVKVCLAAKSPLKTSACEKVKAPAAGSTHKLAFKVSAPKTAKAGSYKLTLTATGAKAQTVTVKVTR